MYYLIKTYDLIDAFEMTGEWFAHRPRHGKREAVKLIQALVRRGYDRDVSISVEKMPEISE